MLQLASLRSEEVQYAVVMETCNGHGNYIIGIRISMLDTIGKFSKYDQSLRVTHSLHHTPFSVGGAWDLQPAWLTLRLTLVRRPHPKMGKEK